jgi:hypothetical protein
MSMKAMLVAAATAATLMVPAAAMAQDWSHSRDYDRRDDRRIETRRWHDGDRRAYSYGYGHVYDRDAYRYARERRERERAWERHRRWEREHRWHGDYDRRF